MDMRVLILTPTALPSITGNAVTAERWRRSLDRKGIRAKVLAIQDKDVPDLLRELEPFGPSLIHVHHAFRAGSLLLGPRTISLLKHIPLVVSPGGTDINLDLEMDDRKETVRQVYRMARFIIVQSDETLKRVEDLFPHLRDRLVLVPKSFHWLGEDVFDLRSAAGFDPHDVLFFLPAGIRPVKGNLECLTAFERVHAARPRARVVFAGPALDRDYAGRFEKKVRESRSFARWIPSVPPSAMRSAYNASDIVLNASSSEGLSNAMLEAIACGRPVLASDIPGNWWPVLGKNGDSPAGRLFDRDDPDDFKRKALSLIDDKELRKAFGQAGVQRALRWPTPEAEAEGLIRVYRAAMEKGRLSGREEKHLHLTPYRPEEQLFQRVCICSYLSRLEEGSEEEETNGRNPLVVGGRKDDRSQT